MMLSSTKQARSLCFVKDLRISCTLNMAEEHHADLHFLLASVQRALPVLFLYLALRVTKFLRHNWLAFDAKLYTLYHGSFYISPVAAHGFEAPTLASRAMMQDRTATGQLCETTPCHSSNKREPPQFPVASMADGCLLVHGHRRGRAAW